MLSSCRVQDVHVLALVAKYNSRDIECPNELALYSTLLSFNSSVKSIETFTLRIGSFFLAAEN